MSNKIPVAVLAATGSVGQRMISLLDGHPWFEVVEVTASERSEGKTYEESCHWFLAKPMPEYVKKMKLLPTKAEALSKAKIVFSALPADIAKVVEPDFAKKGMIVSSNASAYRKDPLVPILVPEVNPDHLDLPEAQHSQYGWSGGIITNPNCTTTGFVVPLYAIDKAYGVTKGFFTSMQALSGAGYPGVPSLDIIDNVIPFIGGEEEKVEFEPRKIMGSFNGAGVNLHDMAISASTNRVAVIDGHTICCTIATEQKATPEEVIETLRNFQVPDAVKDLPSCPKHPIIYHTLDNRPQPRLDRDLENGMSTNVGRLRADNILDFRYVCVSHNTIRGAAGGSIFNGELIARKYFGK